MKITISTVNKKLILEPEDIDDAFVLGELWGKYSDLINVAWSCVASLHFDLLPRDLEAEKIDQTVDTNMG